VDRQVRQRRRQGARAPEIRRRCCVSRLRVRVGNGNGRCPP
jgi:hypothetical protein